MDRSERTKINKLLKSIDPEKVDAVRGMIKNASFDDALTVCRAFLPIEAVENTPDGITPVKKPVKGDRSQNKTIDDKQPDIIPETAGNDENSLTRVNDAGALDMQELETKINAVIDNFCEINDIDDMSKEPQRRFNALASYIGKNVFKNTGILKSDKKINNGSYTATTCNAYDLQKIASALHYFVYLCQYFNKAFTIDAGEAFCGLSDGYITANKEKLTLAGFNPLKKSEETISASILDGRQCVGSIAYLNHVFNWQTASTHTEKKETVVIYPMLSGNINSDNLITSTENN